MKIILKNFGPISRFDFDLSKDLNIIFGKNNIGKSYAISAIYLILKNLINESDNVRAFEIELFFLKKNFNTSKDDLGIELSKSIEEYQKKIIEKFKDKNVEEVDITDYTLKAIEQIINNTFLKNLANSFSNSFSSIHELSNKYANKTFEIILEFNQFSITISAKNNDLYVKKITQKLHVLIKKSVSNRKPFNSENKLTIYYNKKANKVDLYQCIYRLYYGIKREISSVFNDVYFLPASRSGLYQALSTFSAVIAELSKSRTFLSTKIELPNISEPVSDYFLNLSNINTSKSRNKFIDIINAIENEILKGTVLFDKDIKKIVFSHRDIKAELDLSFTSSMISEIAPIVAYLKYVIIEEKGRTGTNSILGVRQSKSEAYSVLFIEEPEAHLHPEVQVSLITIFSELVKKKIKVVMTSHSNYMFNKLSNLILDNKIDYNNVGSYLMYSTDLGSLIDDKAMTADQQGIIDKNFADTAEMLYEERINLYDKLNKI